MAPIPGSVPVAGCIAPFDSTDTYGTHDETYGRGGWRKVNTIAARNAITADRRREGMLVRVLNDGSGVMRFYTLVGGITDGDWAEETFGGHNTGYVVSADTGPGEYATITAALAAVARRCL